LCIFAYVFTFPGNECPKTVKNFVSIAEGFELENKSGNISSNNTNNKNNSTSAASNDAPLTRLQYKGSSFFKIVPSFCLIGGDVVNNDGTGGACIYPDQSSSSSSSNNSNNKNNNDNSSSNSSTNSSKNSESIGKLKSANSSFDDENYTFQHLGLGVVSAAKNNDEGTNSKFFISIRPFPHLDGRNVVFGHVLSGYELLLQLEKFGQKSGGTKKDVRIGDCGLLKDSAVDEVKQDEVR
jgi:cyclophilin family peptidyl-prolyl cis-trans isomerase